MKKIPAIGLPKSKRLKLYEQKFIENTVKNSKVLKSVSQEVFNMQAIKSANRWHTSLATGGQIVMNDIKLCEELSQFVTKNFDVNPYKLPHRYFVNEYGNIRLQIGSGISFNRAVSDDELKELIQIMRRTKNI